MPAVLALYAPNAVLTPTYSKSDLPGAGRGVLVGREKLVNYFHRFLSKNQLCGEIDTMIVQRLAGGVTVYSGLYTFSWLAGGAKSVQARYTYVVQNGLIMTHHSSVVP